MRLEGVEVPGHSFALQLAPGVLDARVAHSCDGFEFGFYCGDAVDQSSELPGQAGEGALFVPCQLHGRLQGEERENSDDAGNAFHNGTFR